MNWIMSANGSIYDHAKSFNKYNYIDWKQSVKYKVNDIVYIYCTKPYQRIMYKTKVEKINLKFDEIRDDKEFWKENDKYEKSKDGTFVKLRLIDKVDTERLSLEFLKENGLKAAPQGPIRASENLVSYINEQFKDDYLDSVFPDEISEVLFEGLKEQVSVNKYERSSRARKKCIEYHGTSCSVCRMNFEEVYGEIGKGFIHVHHIVPLSEINSEYKLNYKDDLIPVCPNCHSMLHKKIDGVQVSLDTLKKIFN